MINPTHTYTWKFLAQVGLILSMLVFVCPVLPARAASTIIVTNANDSGPGSLRQAIADGSAGDTITFAGDYTIRLNSELSIAKELTIDGSGHSITLSGDSDGNGSGNVRVISITSSGRVTLNHLSITSGIASGDYGGGIANLGWLSVMNSTLSANAASVGGAIYNVGTLRVTRSTLSGNWSTDAGVGGGICNNNNGTLTIENSVLSGNTAYDGGGVYNNASTATILNSTLSGNSASGAYSSGGGITNNGTLTVQNSTLSGNTSSYQGGGIAQIQGTGTVQNSTLSGNAASYSGGGIFVYAGSTLSLANTIIANSPSGRDCQSIGSSSITASHTLVEASGSNACGLTNGVNGNIVGQDPLLGPLGMYGGETQTHALLPGSLALDAGQSCLPTDQRGASRPQPAGGACDIGAFEFMQNHTVTFNANLGSGSMSPQTANFPTALTLNAFTRSGYTFSGWNTASNGSGTVYADGATYSFSVDITLYAQWTANTYTVTFNGNGGGTPGPTTKVVTFGSAYGTLATVSRTGYAFAGWYDAASGGNLVTAASIVSTASGHTLYAQWTLGTFLLTIEKHASPTTFFLEGDGITYTYIVTNSSDAALMGVTVTDDKATVSCPKTTLAVGESMTCTASYTITLADRLAGLVTNTAYASGIFEDIPVVSSSVQVTVNRYFLSYYLPMIMFNK